MSYSQQLWMWKHSRLWTEVRLRTKVVSEKATNKIARTQIC